MTPSDRPSRGAAPQPRGATRDPALSSPAEPQAGASAADAGTDAAHGQRHVSKQQRGADPAAHDPSRASASVDSGRHAGQEGERIDAELRNVSEGYDGPKIDEDRATPRRIAKKQGQLDK